ncbi:hypothetical protein J437_LFUL018256, partial [Ladona fulva]
MELHGFERFVQYLRENILQERWYCDFVEGTLALHRDKYEELLWLEKEPRLATERDPKTLLEKAKNSPLELLLFEVAFGTEVLSSSVASKLWDA